jgi:hypothetical protein
MIVRCERHRDLLAEEVKLTVAGQTVSVDLCEDCRRPLLELMMLGRPASTSGPMPVPKRDKQMVDRIRDVPTA